MDNAVYQVNGRFLYSLNENPCVVWKTIASHDEQQIYSYGKIWMATENVKYLLDAFTVEEHSRIVVNINEGPHLIPIILGILNKSCCYCPVNITKYQVDSCLDRYHSTYFICDEPVPETASWKTFSDSREVLGRIIFFYTFTNTRNVKRLIQRLNNDQLSYAIQTSGSTGEPKIVNVPYSCIVENIKSLGTKYSLENKDVIFMASPPTFDPFMVDMLLALTRGAAMLFIPNALRLSPDFLVRLIFGSSGMNATICQMTPSLFRRFNANLLKEYVFHEESSLRILTLGGEPFPAREELQRWPVWNTKSSRNIRIFNIYGITEVSCWSTIEEVHSCEEEPSLGSPLDHHIQLVVCDNEHAIVTNGTGELYIESSKRKCFITPEDMSILGSNDILSRKTGDVVEIRNSKIYYKNRSDDCVKRLGCKINLKTIEDRIKLADKSIHDVSCTYVPQSSLLIAFIVPNDEMIRLSLKQLFKNMDKAEIPDEVLFLDKLPLSSHGKVSKQKLVEYYRTKKSETSESTTNATVAEDIFVEKIRQILSPDNQLWTEKSFLDAGGTSFMALRLVTELEDTFSMNLSDIFIKLLDQNYVLRDVINNCKETIRTNRKRMNSMSLKTLQNELELNLVWKYNMEKCIDASPSLLKIDDKTNIVAVGSHSHKLACLCINQGSEIISLELPDRIESQIINRDQFAIVGCYDGFLYKLHVEKGEVVDKFNSNGMIKCRPLIVDDLVIFGNYSEDHNVFALEFKTFNKCWSRRVGNKSCFASPIRFDKTTIIVCTLDGVVSCLNIETGSTIWEHMFESPVFSTPLKLSPTNLVVAEVSGSIHCIANGVKVCTHNLNASIFSSLVLVKFNSTFIFGCYDHKVYCFQYSDEKKDFSEEWSIQLDGQIYSTPSYFEIENICSYLVACTTKGKMYLIDSANKDIVNYFELGGEVFSSTVIDGNKVFVGCRDNNLYCLEVVKIEDNKREKP